APRGARGNLLRQARRARSRWLIPRTLREPARLLEGRQVRLDRETRGPDRRGEAARAEGQRGAAGERPEQHGADDAAMALSGRLHVEEHDALRARAYQLGEGAMVGDAVTERALLGDRVGAVPRGDERR